MSEPSQMPGAQRDIDSPTATADEDLLAALADDFAACLRRGEHPPVEDYLARHPALAERIRKVFQAVSLMEQSRTIDLAGAKERVGATIGRYKLLECIGEGGFGVVYMAEQLTPVRRKVALKVLKPGMDTRQVLARFEAERQALAIMDHPNIAKVFDAGATDSGRPYFVMELIKGVPITEYCDERQLTPRERLELFAHVCHAVQHAHQKGIIHRDLKPSNVLVMVHDTTPVVKVIDFGVAKALGQELTDKTLFTGFAQLVGTPLYMSPEQAGQSSLDVDTRSDVYSLGVLLYELLTGTTPFDKERFQQAAHDEIRRIIREEEPPKPSTRLSGSKGSLPSISAQRHTEPAKLTKLVRGELDWIVMKALEKDRTRRYETATGLARDVERYLRDEPVEACPPSASYRLRKFFRRNKAKLLTASVIGGALLFAVGSLSWVVRDRTARHARAAGEVASILREVDQLQGEQKWPEALLAARRAETALVSGEADAATAGRVRELLKDLELIDRLEQVRMQQATWTEGKFDNVGADREYARAFREYGVDIEASPIETSIARFKTRPRLAIPLAAALEHWANVHWASKTDAASSKRLVAVARGIDLEPLRDRLRSTWGKPASDVGDELHRLAESIDIRAQHPATLAILAGELRRVERLGSAVRLLRDAQYVYPADFWLNYILAHTLADQKDYEGAVRFYTAAVSIRPHAVAALNNLGIALRQQEKVDEAIVVYRKAIELDPQFAVAYNNLGTTLREQQNLEEAVIAHRKAIELEPKDATAYDNLGATLREQKKLDESIAAYRKAIELDPKFAGAYSNLSIVLQAQKKLDEAIGLCQRAIELDPTLASAYSNLGTALRDQKKLDEAIGYFQKAIELDPKTAIAHHNLGLCLAQQNKLDAALAACRKAIELDPDCASAHGVLGSVLCDQNELEEAVAACRRSIELDPNFAAAYSTLGVVLGRQGKLDEEVAAYRKAIELDGEFAGYYANLGHVLALQNKLDEAIAAFRKGIEVDPKYTDNHFKLGVALMQQKLNEAANALDKPAELLDVNEKKPGDPSTAPPTSPTPRK